MVATQLQTLPDFVQVANKSHLTVADCSSKEPGWAAEQSTEQPKQEKCLGSVGKASAAKTVRLRGP